MIEITKRNLLNSGPTFNGKGLVFQIINNKRIDVYSIDTYNLTGNLFGWMEYDDEKYDGDWRVNIPLPEIGKMLKSWEGDYNLVTPINVIRDIFNFRELKGFTDYSQIEDCVYRISPEDEDLTNWNKEEVKFKVIDNSKEFLTLDDYLHVIKDDREISYYLIEDKDSIKVYIINPYTEKEVWSDLNNLVESEITATFDGEYKNGILTLVFQDYRSELSLSLTDNYIDDINLIYSKYIPKFLRSRYDTFIDSEEGSSMFDDLRSRGIQIVSNVYLSSNKKMNKKYPERKVKIKS